ncbi:ABC transporter ATP-binding protein [Leptolyngbyaceae cyanobacterium CCMR0082]|uniref:ABC transporter ATP-binding protein n=2 Tax=Adonisia turfae TaxID=2950184 RepID=A0A6M0S8R4_9CYAN|nr:ABC transporter ATP-binding protein [Adonisia turfae]NEZ54274.1 ABC transporter ATP-binding protein [Adonisia turfae CCMR0081]NEZ64473.1 ABC transporter ATP-binding protein [Adonisia turfae CCMR0082]
MVAIAANNIQMSFMSGTTETKVLKGIDLAIPRGQIRLMMGPSGSGKTTLLSILAGILTPTAGQVELLGQEITKLSPKELTAFRRDHIGFIFQSFNLFPALTALENIELALQIKHKKGLAIKEQAFDLLKQVGLGDRANNLPADLSGGQKQRVAIARALAGEPELIMADEPTAALDSATGHDVIELMQYLAKNKGCTVLIITHDPRITDAADEITYLEDGVLAKQSSLVSGFH